MNKKPSFFRQAGVLIDRYFHIFFNDKQNLILTVAIPLLTILIVCIVACPEMYTIKPEDDHSKNNGYPVLVWETVVQEEKNDDKMIIGDFYVSTKGNDSNSGTKDAPFLTIEKAVEAVRNIDKTDKNGITVCIEAGEYRISSLEFTKDDSGTAECPVTYCAIGGEVILNGGVTLSSHDFKSVSEYPEISERLTPEAQKNVVVIDLTKAPYSLTKDDWGKIYAIGSINY